MPIEPNTMELIVDEPIVKKARKVASLVGDKRVKLFQRDVALTYPSLDENAASVDETEQALSVYLNDGWTIQDTKLEFRREVYVMEHNESFINLIVLLVR